MNTRMSLLVAAIISTCSSVGGPAMADGTIRIGFLAPLSGPFTQNGKQMVAGLNYFMKENGNSVAGRKIEVIVRDDGGQPDAAKRIAQELIINDKVSVLAGFNVTPVALAVAPLSAEAKIPMIVTAAAGSVVTARSPYIARTFFTLPQAAVPMGTWAANNGIKKVVTMVSDYVPGVDAERAFTEEFKAHGGQITESLRIPLQNPDFAPFLQRASDAKPDAIFLFVPGNFAGPLARQYVERGLAQSGIKLIGTGDITDDDVLNRMGDAMLGAITSHQYSAAHDSPKNKAFVQGISEMNNGMRANYVAVATYDGMALLYEALRRTDGNTDGEGLIKAMKGMSLESPRGPIFIDPATRDIVQNIYIREVKRVDNELYNIEFETVEAVKDPGKSFKP
jgi:branched-chain amino acid transport system substrate-binding protein